MRPILTALTAFALAFSLVAQTTPATAAVENMDSRYFGESAFLLLSPGQAGQFAAGFDNTGALGWQSGTNTQVNLASCLDDKITCNVPAEESAWANGWYSTVAYATQSTSFVGPGQTGWFVYSVRAPASATAGTTARFNGDLVQAATGQKLRAEGYYQDATVSSTSSSATALDAEPEFQGKQIGAQATITATVTADPPTGSTTRQPVANQEVTFQVVSTSATPAGSNGNLTFTAITNASGVASISYTRNNPGTDQVEVYVTGAPTVRDSVSVAWGTAATTVSVTEDTAETLPNDDCRTYHVIGNDLNGNALADIELNFLENLNEDGDVASDSDAVADNVDEGATMAANAVAEGASYTLALTAGEADFDVCGAGTATTTLTPMAFDDTNADEHWDTGELGDAGGQVTFEARVLASITVTPDTAATETIGTQRVFTINALDQFGDGFTGTLDVGSLQEFDNLAATNTDAIVVWYDADGDTTDPDVDCATTPGTATASGAQKAEVTLVDGLATFALCSDTADDTAQALAFEDSDDSEFLESDETSDTGGNTTWEDAVLTACTLEITTGGAQNPSGDTDPTNANTGDVTVTYTFVDQAGNPIDPTGTPTVTFTTTNTGGSTTSIYVEAEGGDADTTAGGTSDTTTTTAIADADGYLLLTSDVATTGTVSATATVSSTAYACGPVSVAWILVSTEPNATTTPPGTVTGTVIYVDNGVDPDDGITSYIIQTSVGNFLVTSAAADNFLVEGTTSTATQWENALSVGDSVTFTDGGDGDTDAMADTHSITTNAP